MIRFGSQPISTKKWEQFRKDAPFLRCCHVTACPGNRDNTSAVCPNSLFQGLPTKSLMVDSRKIVKGYQNYLDRLNEKTGRQITKEDLDTQEKRDRLAQEWKTRNLGEGSNPEPSTNRDGESKLSSSKREK